MEKVSDKKFNNKACSMSGCEGHMKWLVETLGPVILGAKPAEIISYRKFDCTRCEKLQAIDMTFSQSVKIRYLRIEQENGQIKIIFYDPEHLDKVLSDQRIRKFLYTLGYPQDGNTQELLEVLAGRLEKGQCPDEIGVFLGYPLKDVIGYMGHPSLPLTKIQYWRVYGDATESDKLYERIVASRNQIKCLMHENSLSCVLEAI